MPLLLRLPDSPSNVREKIERSVRGAPLQSGAAITVRFAPSLTASRGKLLSGLKTGTPVHAASFLRRREVVLEAELLGKPRMLRFILLHELFHFAWMRLGSGARSTYRELLAAEVSRAARGEMGESSIVAKDRWRSDPNSSVRWRDYVCESFCDTAAAFSTGARQGSLAGRWRQARDRWFATHMPAGGWRC